MQGPDRQLGEGGVDQQRELDLRDRDGTDVDGAVGQRPERIGGDAGVAARADAWRAWSMVPDALVVAVGTKR